MADGSTDDHGASVNANPDCEAVVVSILGRCQPPNASDNFPRGEDRSVAIILVDDRCAEDGDEAVGAALGDDALVSIDRLGGDRHQLSHEMLHAADAEAFNDGCCIRDGAIQHARVFSFAM